MEIKKFIKAVLCLITALCLTACTGKTSEPSEAEFSDYQGNGWKVSYDTGCFAMTEKSGAVEFSFKDKDITDMLTISYSEGKMPEEVIYDATCDIDQEKVSRNEGYFAGQKDWCFTRDIQPEDTADNVGRHYSGVEHNGGTLLISVTWKKTEEEVSYSSDKISEILDTFEFTDHKPQEEYSYIPGIYEKTYEEDIEGKTEQFTYSVELNSDHTGMLHMQDDIEIYWTSIKIVPENSAVDGYEFKVEGDMLYLDLGGTWEEFERSR